MQDDVDMGGWKVSSKELKTSGASTCIVLAAHNESTRQGMIGHFSSIAEEPPGDFRHGQSFREAIAAINSLGDPTATTIWLGGGAPFIEDGKDSVEQDRSLAEELTSQYIKDSVIPETQLEIEWSEQGRVLDIELNCEIGILVVHNYPNISMRLALDALAAAQAENPRPHNK